MFRSLRISFVLMLFLFSGCNNQPDFSATTVKIDTIVPDFTLMDLDGKKHSLSDYKDKYVVLEWVNYDCPFVKKHYDSKNMQKLQKKYMDKGVIWLSICSSAAGKQGYFTKEELKKRMSSLGASPTAYLIDEDGKVGKQFGAKTTPHLFITNTKAILIYAGAIDNKRSTKIEDIKGSQNYVQLSLDASLEGKEIETKVTKAYGCSVKYK